MGWRVSWYKADKNQPISFEKYDEEGEKYTFDKVNGKCLLNNQGTEFWLNLKNNDDFKKEIKCLYEDADIDLYSITKEGFKQIILAYRERIIEYQKQALENDSNPELLKKWDRCTDTPRTLIESELREWEYSFYDDNNNISYFAIDLSDNKEIVSGSWKYKYAIFDMINVYKHFDWENYTMVVYGG